MIPGMNPSALVVVQSENLEALPSETKEPGREAISISSSLQVKNV